jgi:glycine cleavage system H protein
LSTVESVKAVSELFSPVSGEVLEVNGALQAKPETINGDPHGAGWMIVLKLKDPQEAAKLMDAAAYEAHTKGDGK